MAVLLADRDMVNIVEEQRKMLQQTRYNSSSGCIKNLDGGKSRSTLRKIKCCGFGS
jgi:hypothetical protein